MQVDREMPAVKSMLPLLKWGIGVHHSGLLPLLKEVVEILFQEQLIKVTSYPVTRQEGFSLKVLGVPAWHHGRSVAVMPHHTNQNAMQS